MAKYRSSHEFRKGHRERNKKYKQRIRLETLSLLGELKCCKCDFDNYLALHIDHIYGGGHQERKRYPSVLQQKKLIEANPQNYQILCANCNAIKRVINKEVIKQSKYDD